MSFVKISELEKAGQPVLSDVLPIINDNETRTVSLEQIINMAVNAAKENIKIFSIKVVASLDSMTDENVLYLKWNNKGDTNRYDEYLVIDGKPEKIGTVDIDLTPYAKTADVEKMIDDAIAESITGALEGSY